jgi:hypothetical protein
MRKLPAFRPALQKTLAKKKRMSVASLFAAAGCKNPNAILDAYLSLMAFGLSQVRGDQI